MTAHVQREARALGDPTRTGCPYIADAPERGGRATSHVGLNHNAGASTAAKEAGRDGGNGGRGAAGHG